MVYVGGAQSSSAAVPKMNKTSTYGYMLAFAAAMGGLLFGYEIGVVSQVLGMPGFQLQFGSSPGVSADGITLIADKLATGKVDQLTTFTFLAGCFFGALIVSYMADAFGRKRSIIIGGLGFLVGGAIQTTASGFTAYSSGRVISGLGIGVLSMCSPLYISEAAPSEIRGRMLTVQQLMITIGILVASIFNAIFIILWEDKPASWDLEWRLSMAMQCLPALLLVVVMFVMPESPRWLATRGRDQEAITIIGKLRSETSRDAGTIAEYKIITDSIESERLVGNGSWSELFVPGLRNRLLIAMTLQFWQQWTGINVILYYQSGLLEAMGLSHFAATVQFTLANNVVNFLGTFPGMYLIERLGRRKLLLFGGIGMGLSHLLVFSFLSAKNSTGSFFYSYLAIFSMYLFVLCFSSTWGPVVWAYQSEIFPQRVRAKGTGAATMSNWFWNAIIAYVAVNMREALAEKIYLVFMGTGFTMATFTYLFVPETMGRTLEEMDELFGTPQNSLEYGKSK